MFFDFNLKFVDILSVNNLESLLELESVIGNSDHFHRQSCCSCHWVDQSNYNASDAEYPTSSSSSICQRCFPLNVYVHESLSCYQLLHYEFINQVNLN
jgi:hypothetical protein